MRLFRLSIRVKLVSGLGTKRSTAPERSLSSKLKKTGNAGKCGDTLGKLRDPTSTSRGCTSTGCNLGGPQWRSLGCQEIQWMLGAETARLWGSPIALKAMPMVATFQRLSRDVDPLLALVPRGSQRGLFGLHNSGREPTSHNATFCTKACAAVYGVRSSFAGLPAKLFSSTAGPKGFFSVASPINRNHCKGLAATKEPSVQLLIARLRRE